MIRQFQYRGLDDPNVYYTDDYKMQVMNHRMNLNALAEALIDQGENQRANEVIDFSLAKIPTSVISYDPSFPDTVNLLYRLDRNKLATTLASNAWKASRETVSYLITEEPEVTMELRKGIFIMDSMQRSLYVNGETELAEKMEADFENLMATLQRKRESE
jgi:hypothetical protein